MLDWSDDKCGKSTEILLARMAKRTLWLDWNGVKLECAYEYTPAEKETRVDPGTPECFDLISAFTSTGFDMLDYGGEIYNDIADAAYQEFRGEA